MTRIINIRGTSGSGKSTLVRALMDSLTDVKPVMKILGDDKEAVRGYIGRNGENAVGIVGRYETDCGGCDTIKTQDEIAQRVNHFSTRGAVVFEGLLISVLHSRYRDMARGFNDIHKRTENYTLPLLGKETTTFPPFIFAFLDTPLDVCLARVEERRARKGNTKPFNPQNTIDKWHTCQVVADKFEADGLPVVWLDHTNPLPQLQDLLKGAL